MKTSLRKLVAAVSGLAIAAVLPMTSLMASADGASVSFTADKTNVKAGDEVTLSINVKGVSKDNPWHLMSFTVGYDEAQLEPTLQYDEILDEDVEAVAGSALISANTVLTATFKNDKDEVVNPIQGAIVSTTNQRNEGTVLTLKFTVKDGVKDGDTIKLDTKLLSMQKSVVVEGTPVNSDVAAPADSTVTMTVGTVTPPDPTKTQAPDPTKTQAPDPTKTQAPDPTKTQAPDPTVTGDVEPTTPTSDDVTLPEPTATTADNGGNGGAQTGESTTLFVLALVLMAGSAVALVGMKKKVFSK